MVVTEVSSVPTGAAVKDVSILLIAVLLCTAILTANATWVSGNIA
jgi:hypothetical protein